MPPQHLGSKFAMTADPMREALSEHERTELIDGLRMTAKYLANNGKTAAIYCVRAAEALSPPIQERWKPIESAPKDVDGYLLATVEGTDFPIVVCWRANKWCSISDLSATYPQPTLWQPCPAPPPSRKGSRMGDLSKPSLREIPDEKLLRRAVKSARARDLRRGEKHERWTAVADAFALGSTFAAQLCRRFDLDPSEQVER